MPTQTWVLTVEERLLINEVYNANLLDDAGWARFYERVRTSPRREGAIENALLSEGLGDRVRRNLHAIQHGLSDPQVGIDAAKEHFEHHGVVGGLAEIAKSAVTTPIRSAGTVLGGEGLGEKPLETVIGLTGFIPAGRFAGVAAGAGLRRAGIGALGNAAARQSLLNQARRVGADAARAAQAGGASLDDAIREGFRAAQEAAAAANPKAASMIAAGERLGQLASSPRLTAASRVIEGADVAVGAEEWPLELAGELMLEGGATLLGRYARSLHDAIRNDLSSDGPPPDTPPQQPTGTLPPGPTPTQPQQSPTETDSQPTPRSPTPQAEIFISELWQTDDGSPVAPNTTGAKQTQHQTRKYSFGDASDPDSVGVLTIKRVPNPNGKLDNKHYQAWFDGGGVTGVTEAAPLTFTAEEGINSYTEAVDAALSQVPDLVSQQPETSREQRTQRRQENREAREQARQPEELNAIIEKYTQRLVDAAPIEDMGEHLAPMYEELKAIGIEDVDEQVKIQEQVLRAVNARAQEQQQQPAPPAEIEEMDEEALEEMVQNSAEGITYWMIEHGTGNVEDIEDTVEQHITEGVHMGDITEAEGEKLYPAIVERVQDILPTVKADIEAAEAVAAEINQQIAETLPNVKYKKSTLEVERDGETVTFDGYMVENTGIDYANVFITKTKSNNWQVVEHSTRKPLATGAFNTRKEAVEAALGTVIGNDEATYRREFLGETPDEQIGSDDSMDDGGTPPAENTSPTPEASEQEATPEPAQPQETPQEEPQTEEETPEVDETPEPESETPISTTPTALVDLMQRIAFADGATPEQKLEEAIYRYIGRATLTAEPLFAGATAAYGSDKYNSQTVYDIMEVAANRLLADSGLMDVNVDAEDALANIKAIQTVEARLPRQADRTAEREQNQQYSTPFHYSYLVNWVANLQENDIVLEPSAGTGNLAWYAKQIGAEVHVNDIGKVRHRLLKENFENTTNADATQIDVRLPNVKPTLVVMNPPFSSTQGQKKNIRLGVNMVEASLKSLQPGGRLVAIVNGGRDLTPEMKAGEKPGGGPNFMSQDYRKWWSRIGKSYLIRANVHVSGEVYKAFGTSFNTRLLVIDKPDGENPNPVRDAEGNLKPEFQAMQLQRVDTVTELVEMLQEVRDARKTDTEQQRTEPARQTPADATPGERPGTDQQERDATGTLPATPDGVAAESGEPAVPPSEPSDATGEATRTEGAAPETGVDVVEPLETPRSDTERTDTPESSVRGDGDTQDATVPRDTGTGGSDLDTVDPSKTWVPTVDSHIVKGRRVNLMETISLATIASPNVADIEINIPNDFLQLYSDAQKKAIRLILRAHEAHIEPETVGDTPPRRGFYLGDDTGVGKTWMTSGVIIHHQNQGNKRHIYLTQTQDLINDFMEAFPIAGGEADTLFNINDKKQNNGVMISTYSTLAGKQGDTTRISEMLTFATGLKPPESLLRPQTDVELISFGELPRTFELAFNMYNAGKALPKELQDMMEAFEKEQNFSGRSTSNPGEAWTDQYQAILEKSDALRAAEGGITPFKWIENAKKFEGVLVFDEAHTMKNDKSTKEKDASATAQKGKLLSKLLPNARVIYASATGTTEIANYSYMERLGIWGREKPFSNANAFIMEMGRGGIASQEVVARDLKAKGLFISRSQDFSDVIVRSMVHELTDDQVQAYNDFANVYQQIRLYLMDYQAAIDDLKEEASEEGERVNAKKASVSWSGFYNKQQRFFQAMLATFKMQSVIPDMIQQVESGKKVTIQVVNTYEANQKRQEERALRAGTDISDIEITAREILEEYLDEETGALPVFSHEVIVNAETDAKEIRVITNDTDEIMEMPNGMRVPPGQPIPNMELVAKRDALIELLYRSKLPSPPIDQVIQAFKERDIEVAEITGRKKRYYFNAAGERVAETLSPTRTKELARRFNENEIMVLIFSRKGATGANYPATDPNHPIVQYVIDIGWEADKFKQGLGRSKRSNEVAPPEIVNTATNMVGELRFQATAASRAAEMGATTRGQAQEGTGLDLFTFDAKYLNSDYGKKALYSFLYEMYRGLTFDVPGATNDKGQPLKIGWHATDTTESFYRITGIDVKEDSKGRLDFYRVSVNQFMNRVLGAPSIAIQNELYSQFFRRLNHLLEEAKANDTLDTGVETLPTLAASIQDEKTIYTDPDSGAKTFTTSVAIEQEPNYIDYSEVAGSVTWNKDRGDTITSFYVRADEQLFFDEETASRTDEDGKVIQRVKRVGPRGTIRYINLKDAYTDPDAGTRHQLSALSAEQINEFKEQWEAEIGALPETRQSTVTLVRGLMIDVWDKINPPVYGSDSNVARELAKRKLVRIVLDNGTNLIGRMLTTANDYRELLERFGLEVDPSEIAAEKRSVTLAETVDMIEGGWTIELNGGFTVRQRRRAGQPYLAVEGDTNRLSQLVTDNVLQRVRPSGGAVTYVLPSGNVSTFFDQYTPIAAVQMRQNNVNRIELEYDANTPIGVPDDDGGNDDGSPDTPPEPGGGTPAPVAPVPADAQQSAQPVPANTGGTQTPSPARSTPSGSDSSPQPQQSPEPDAETPETEMTDEQKIELAVTKISQWVKEEIQKGTDEQAALDTLTKNSIWHGSELYALETFAGQSPEEVRDYLRKEIVNKINRERMRTGGRGVILMAQPAPVATQEMTPETIDTLADALHAQLTNMEIPPQLTENISGTLTFSLREPITAEIKKAQNYDTMKSAIVRFYMTSEAAPIEKYYRGKSLSPENIVDTLRKEITLNEIKQALRGEPVTLDTSPSQPDETPEQTPEEKVSIPPPPTVDVIESPDLAAQTAVRVAEERKNAPEADDALKADLRRGVLHAIENKLYKKADNDSDWNAYRTKYEDVQGLIEFHANTTNSIRITPTLPTVFKPFDVEVSADVINSITTKAQRAGFKRMETPDESTTPQGNRSTTEQQTPEPESDISQTAPIQPSEPDTTVPTDSDERRSADSDGDSGVPDGEYIYHGAIFTEERGKLSITGDAIPESFWDYYHSGGRGRNSAHKRAMKEAGWNYTFRGSKPRIYTFSISIPDFKRWKAAHPDDGSAPVDLAEQGADEQLAFMEDLRNAEIEVVITDPASSWRDNAHHFIFEGVDGVRGSVRREKDLRRNARSYFKDSYEVVLYGDAMHNLNKSIAWRDMDGITEDNFSDFDNKKSAIRKALENTEAAEIDFKPKPEEVPQIPEAPQDQLFTEVLAKMEDGSFRWEDGKYIVGTDTLGKVSVSLLRRRVSSIEPGRPTEESIETELSFISQESPSRFTYLSVDVPAEVVRAWDNKFEDEHLDDIRDPNNWERLGRKHAFVHKSLEWKGEATTAAVSKHYSGKYEVRFSNMPSVGVTYNLVSGANLLERFHNGLEALQPYMFVYAPFKEGMILDALRAKTGQAVSFGQPEPEPEPESESWIDNLESWRETFYTYATEYEPKAVEGQPGVYEAEIDHDGQTDTIRWTLTRGHIETQPGLFGREEPVRYDLAKTVKIESELFDPITRTVDLAHAESTMTGILAGEEIGTMREDDPDKLAIEMVSQQLTPDDLSLSLEIGLALAELGLMEITEWKKLTPAQQTTALNEVTTRLYEASGDNSLTATQTKAINILQERANKWEREQVGFKPVSGGAPLTVTLDTVLDVPNIPDADITKSAARLKKLIHPGTKLAEKLDGLTPKMRLWAERSRREYLSGYKNLATLGPVGKALRAAAEYVLDIQDRGSIVDLRQLETHQKALTDLIKQRTVKGMSKEVMHGDLSEQIYRYIEENTPIEDDAELQKVSDGWKEAWRPILKNHILHMLQLRREVASLEGDERVVIRRADGSGARDWTPDQLPDHTWDDDKQMYQRESDGVWLSVSDAIDQADKLYLPRHYPSSHWNAVMDQVNVKKVIKQLDAALDKPKTTKIVGFAYDKASKTWTFTRTGDTYTDKAEAVKAGKEYWSSQYALAQEMLAQKENAVIGRYGHLELERETTDKLYNRDVSYLLDHVQMFWRRVGEIAAWGQYDPVLGNWPRLAKYIARIGETALDSREHALKMVASTLMESESGMFERLPSFREGEQQAANIMQHWNTPDLEKMRTENPDKFNDAVMQTLVDIGFAEHVSGAGGDTYQLKGKSEKAQRSTFIRHLVPYFQTIDLREETVLKIVRGIGHWQPVDRQNNNANKVWHGINHLTTTMTLGLGTSFQNMAEVPLLATIAGSKNTATALQRLTNDAEFREMLPNLGAALAKARDYLADTDTQSKYLTFTLFTATEKWSRLAGVAVGWQAAKDAIAKYLADPSVTNRKRLEELNISVKTIDDYRSVLPVPGEVPDFDALVREAESRVLEGAMMVSGLKKHDAAPPSHMHVDLVGDEMARAARYVSIRVFKGYNPLSLPNFLTKQDPLVRTFFKFKSWSAQMHQFMWEMFGNAGREARQGNWGPAWRLSQGFVFMGVSAAALAAFFRFMSGRDDDDDNRLIQAIAMNQTLGIASMIIELAQYADGNPYKASRLISSAFGSPTAGVLAHVGSNLIAGQPTDAASTTFWQLPGVREARRFGGGAIPALRRGE